MTVMESSPPDTLTWVTHRMSLSHLKRSITPRVLASLAVVWLAGSIFGKHAEITDSYVPPLGSSVPIESKYGLNPTKLALVLEPFHLSHSAFHILHTINVLPSDWPVLFVGTPNAVSLLNESYAVQMAQEKGRLTLQPAPEWINFADERAIERTLAQPEFYNSLPEQVEHLFITGMDSVMCSASLTTLDDWLEYDWVGSPWDGNSWSEGHNGYSLRRVSKAKQALRTVHDKIYNIADSDLMAVMRSMPKAVLPDKARSPLFVLEEDWVDRPMAVHPHMSLLSIDEAWSTLENRKGIFAYCPEVKVVMQMKLERERCTPERMAKLPRGKLKEMIKEIEAELEQQEIDAEAGRKHGKMKADQAKAAKAEAVKAVNRKDWEKLKQEAEEETEREQERQAQAAKEQEEELKAFAKQVLADNPEKETKEEENERQAQADAELEKHLNQGEGDIQAAEVAAAANADS